MLAHPVERFGVAQIEQQIVRIVRALEQPFGMFLRDLAAYGDAFGFEPYHELGAGFVRGFRQRLQSVRETLLVHLPCAYRVIPVFPREVGAAASLVPSGVEPEDFGHDAELSVALGQREGEIFCQAAVLVAGCGIAPAVSARERIFGEAAVQFGRMVGEHETAERVMADHAVFALPEQHAYERRADRLVRQQVEVHVLHARGQRRGAGRLLRYVDVPVAGPADGDDRAPSVRCLEIHERKSGMVRRASAFGGDINRFVRFHRRRQRPEVVATAVASHGMVQREGSVLSRLHAEIGDLDIGQHGGVALRCIRKVQHPLDGAELLEARDTAGYFQTGDGIGVGEQVFDRSRFVARSLACRVFPFADELGRRLAVVDEREGRNVSFGESRFDPSLHVFGDGHSLPALAFAGRRQQNEQRHEGEQSDACLCIHSIHKCSVRVNDFSETK